VWWRWWWAGAGHVQHGVRSDARRTAGSLCAEGGSSPRRWCACAAAAQCWGRVRLLSNAWRVHAGTLSNDSIRREKSVLAALQVVSRVARVCNTVVRSVTEPARSLVRRNTRSRRALWCCGESCLAAWLPAARLPLPACCSIFLAAFSCVCVCVGSMDACGRAPCPAAVSRARWRAS
jgi:hypothetical protein